MASTAPASETLEIVPSPDRTPIAVWRTGDRPPLVLVHGATADHRRWAPVLPALAGRFTVLAVDRRGRGASGDGPVYALEREVEDVAAVVEWAGAGARLLGHSHGAVCALEAARLAGDLAQEDGEQLVAALPEEQIDLMRSLPAWDGRLAAAHTIPREERANREYEFDPRRFVAVDVPTLLLVGGDSPAAFREAAEAAQAALPYCRLAVMPGQRHVAMDTAPALFTTEILTFLKGD